ncbi:hypothetical protein PV325_001198, partial [Microctonus aethiopoides]
ITGPGVGAGEEVATAPGSREGSGQVSSSRIQLESTRGVSKTTTTTTSTTQRKDERQHSLDFVARRPNRERVTTKILFSLRVRPRISRKRTRAPKGSRVEVERD